MYLSLIWQIFSSKILLQKLLSGLWVLNAPHAHSLARQVEEGHEEEDEGGALGTKGCRAARLKYRKSKGLRRALEVSKSKGMLMRLSNPHATPSAKVYKSDVCGILPRLLVYVGRLARLVSSVPTWAEFFLTPTVIAAPVGRSLNG